VSSTLKMEAMNSFETLITNQEAKGHQRPGRFQSITVTIKSFPKGWSSSVIQTCVQTLSFLVLWQALHGIRSKKISSQPPLIHKAYERDASCPACCSYDCPDDGGSKYPRNVSKLLLDNTANIQKAVTFNSDFGSFLFSRGRNWDFLKAS
jgi:hypothetical protein